METYRLYIKDQQLLGYYMPGLGEGTFGADQKEAGLELIKIRSLHFDHAALPSNNQAGIDFLKANGFVPAPNKGTRMLTGKNVHWRPEKIYGRIGGNYSNM